MKRAFLTAALILVAAWCVGARYRRQVWELQHADQIARWCLEADSSAVTW